MGCDSYSGLIVALIAILCAFYSWNANWILDQIPFLKHEEIIELTIANSWRKLIVKPDAKFNRIAVGTNGNVDLIVKGSSLLKQLDSTSNSSTINHVDHPYLSGINDLKETFGYFHQRGAGGERYMNNHEEFQHILNIARKVSDVQYFIGGNGALMAQKLASLMSDDGQVLIGCPVGPVLQPLLHPNIKIISSSHMKQDEYHLIMEYEKGEKWDGHVAPIASRFIFSHDINNSKMLSFEGLISRLKEFESDLLVLSGFHLLEAESAFRSERLNKIAELLRKIPRYIPIHVELASMSDKKYVKELADKIFPLVDSVGLNEQELWLLCQVNDGPHCSSKFPHGPPSVSQAADNLSWMLLKFSGVSHSRLSRVHFHTLTYHVAITLSDSRWRNQVSAVLAGTRIAANQACDDDASERPEKFELKISGYLNLSSISSEENVRNVLFHPHFPVITWRRQGLNHHLSPVLVCRKPLKTVGLGDAISAIGLFYSGYV